MPKETPNANGFVAGVELFKDPTYLGNLAVVDGLTRVFVAAVVQAPAPEDINQAVDRMALIFSGSSDDYKPVPDWNGTGLARVMCERASIDPAQNTVDIMRTFFAGQALEAMHLVKKYADAEDNEWMWQIDAIIEYVSSMLLGTIDLTHPLEDE